MRRAFTAFLVVVLLAVSTVGVGTAAAVGGHDHAQDTAEDLGDAGHVHAQQNATPTTTSTNGSDDDQASEENSTVVDQVDEDVRVVGYSYDAEAEQFSVELENTGDVTSSVTITEVIGKRQAGAGTFGIAVVEVRPGETVTAQVTASRVSGTAAVMVLTQKSILDGRGTYLQESQRTNTNLIPGGSSGSDVRAAYAGGVVVVALGMLLGGWQYLASSNQGVRPADVTPKTNILGRFRK